MHTWGPGPRAQPVHCPVSSLERETLWKGRNREGKTGRDRLLEQRACSLSSAYFMPGTALSTQESTTYRHQELSGTTLCPLGSTA